MRIEANNVYNYEFKQKADNEKAKKLLEDHKSELERIRQEFENLDESARNSQRQTKILITCLRISRRIISGNIVPAKDHKYLREHDPALYSKSIQLIIPKKKPYKYKQLSEDEETQNNAPDGVTAREGFDAIVGGNSAGEDVSTSSIDVQV